MDISAAEISRIYRQCDASCAGMAQSSARSSLPLCIFGLYVFKVRVNRVVGTRAIYNILGVDILGRKDVLGLYTVENEGAKFWLSVLTDLKTRGVENILIACVDGLKGFPEAVESNLPKDQCATLHRSPDPLFHALCS